MQQTTKEMPPNLSTRLPTVDEQQQATAALTLFTQTKAQKQAVKMQINDQAVVIPDSIAATLSNVLKHIASGEMVSVIPYGAVLTTQKAADLLNVSRPFLTKLLESGEMPFHRVGRHRRVLAEDVLAYMNQRTEKREKGLALLQELGQEFDKEFDQSV